MAARRAGGDVAGVENVQVEAQVDQVKVHGGKFSGDCAGPFASKCGSGLAREEGISLTKNKRLPQYMANFPDH